MNCNNAAKNAKGEYILFLNNDTQVQENWLQPLVDLMEQDSTIGMTGSKLVYADGRLQEAGGIFWKDASAWNYGNRCNPEEPEYNYVKDADYISGAAIMIRHNLWKEIGGFGHPPNIDAVLWFGREVFPKILEKYPDIKWYVVGSKVTEEIQAMASDNIYWCRGLECRGACI